MTNRTKAITGLIAVFILGGICGALIFGVVVRDRVKEAQDLRRQEGFITYFERRLDLTEAQRDSLHDELAAAYEQLAELRSSASARYNEVIDTLKSQIYPHLTVEQRELFNTQEMKFRRFMPHEPRGRGKRGRQHMSEEVERMMQTPVDTTGASSGAGKVTSKGNVTVAKPSDAAVSATSDAAADTAVAEEEGLVKLLRERSEKLKQRMNLTDDQTRQIKSIIDDARARGRQARIDFAGQPFMRRKVGREIIRDAQRKIGSLLTPEQRDEYAKIRDEIRGGKKKRGTEGQAGR